MLFIILFKFYQIFIHFMFLIIFFHEQKNQYFIDFYFLILMIKFFIIYVNLLFLLQNHQFTFLITNFQISLYLGQTRPLKYLFIEILYVLPYVRLIEIFLFHLHFI